MTCKVTRKTHTLRVIAQLFGVLTVLIALVALAQTKGSGQKSGRPSVLSASTDISSDLLTREHSPQPRSAGAEPVAKAGFGTEDMAPGAPFFLPPVIYDPEGYGFRIGGFGFLSVAVADVNGDGKPDLVVANYLACETCAHGSVAVLLGNGDGTFQSAVTYDSGAARTESVAVADVNGDGKPDVVMASDCGACSGEVAVLLGNGDGTFQPVVTIIAAGFGGNSIVVADVNGDGKLDVVTLGSCPAGCPGSDSVVTVLLGRGDGTFGITGGVYYGGYDTGGLEAFSLAVADVNGDGKPDILVGNYCTIVRGNCAGDGSVGLLLGKGDGYFQPVVNYSGVSRPSDVVITDVNGDGKPDLVLATSAGLGVLLGNGDGTFQPMTDYPAGARRVAVADINGDGKLDLVGETYGSVSVLPGNGDGTFQPAVTQVEGDLRSIAVADLNGDGRLDLVVGTTDGNTKPLIGVLLHVGNVSTTTTVVSSPNPSAFGQSVTFTATVRAASGTPTGTVMFYDGSMLLGSAALVNRKASLSVSTLVSGSRSITAVYQGSLKFNSSSSAPFQQVVNPATTTSSLASSLNPALVNESVTYTATVASQYGGAVTGTIMFQDGGLTVATVTMVGNQAAYSTSYGSPGTHSITATYSGDTNNTGSVSATLVEQINKGFPSKTMLTTSGSPSLVGQPVTFTATVMSGHGLIPDGELVTFYDGTTAIGTGTTASSVATFTTSSLTAKTHTIKATYAGDAIFQGSTGTVMQVVNKYSTTTTLTSSPNPSQSGQAVTFTATVTSAGPAPTGKVKFLDGTTGIGSATLSGGVAKLTKSTLTVGTHPITAQYMGDAFSAKSTSPVVNQVVQ